MVGVRVLGKVSAGRGPSVILYQTSIPESIPDCIQVLPQVDTLVNREEVGNQLLQNHLW